MPQATVGALHRFAFLAKVGYVSLRRAKLHRDVSTVGTEYSAGWRQYEQHLERSGTLDQWLRIPGVDDTPHYCSVDARLRFASFDSMTFYRSQLTRALRTYFPQARSITEYGSGLGRNLLVLKRDQPELDVYGYELCEPGVQIGRRAALKFGFEVQYAKLDFVNAVPTDFAFPETDVAFTMFALEQLPRGSDVAMRNILAQVRLGTVHIEPVPENYPLTYRGMVGRLDHWKADYLQGFERTVTGLPLADVRREVLRSSHNPLMFPTLYVLRKAAVDPAWREPAPALAAG
jgi:hypothetical protein